jgi:mannose-1-phosphate guanylyltransferase
LVKSGKFNFYPVILAGGRGTRFWPLSRKRKAKQLLPLNSDRSMIQETFDRLVPFSKAQNFWVITNDDLRIPIARQLRKLNKKQILAEPCGRNTAPAIGLAAFLLLREDPNAVLGLFPSDHVVTDEKKFRSDLKHAVEIAASGENIVVIGIPPTRAETGYGYIEAGAKAKNGALEVRRFREKPDATTAARFLEEGNYFWNGGIFIWSAKTLANALSEHLPKTASLLQEIASHHVSRKFDRVLAKLYPKCENISVDYAIAEPRSAKGEGKSGIYCIPASFGWNDLGSWTALYEHRQKQQDEHENVVSAKSNFMLNAGGNFILSDKFVAAVGVNNLVVVETDDALLITTLDDSQDVGRVVKYLDEKKMEKLV